MTSREAAEAAVTICEELDLRIEMGRGCGYNLVQLAEAVFGDGLHGKLKVCIISACGTHILRNFLLDEDLLDYGLFGKRRPFGLWPRDHGIDPGKGEYGIFEKIGAREYERDQLLFWEPVSIRTAFRSLQLSQMTEAQKWAARELNERLERFCRWRDEFNAYYGEAYDRGRRLKEERCLY